MTTSLTKLDTITSPILSAAIEVHRSLGPGLLESVYSQCLVCELERRGLRVETERLVPLVYRGLTLRTCLRLDLVVEGQVIVEVKAVDGLVPVHQAQLMTYLKLAQCPAGLLLNFNVPVLRDGIKRVLNPPVLERWLTEGTKGTE